MRGEPRSSDQGRREKRHLYPLSHAVDKLSNFTRSIEEVTAPTDTHNQITEDILYFVFQEMQTVQKKKLTYHPLFEKKKKLYNTCLYV